ncbi:MAG: urease accessory protein UreE [Geminicoccaceae bacterium]|nr:MAG: urease accessory protein UreE [Geminicoccaceae bacterium]
MGAAAVEPAAVVDRVALDLEGRRKRRHVVTTVKGNAILIDLAEVPSLHDGDGLVLEDGGVVRVEALPEDLMEVTVSDAAERVKVAWHLGNRHLAVQFVGEAMRIRQDHVIKVMLEGLGARVVELSAAFDPEAGAYGHQHGGHQHGGHGHGHG